MKRLPFVVYPHPKYNGAEKICSILLPTYWERCIHVTRCGGQCVDNLSLYCEQTDSERARLCYWSQGDVAALGFTQSTWVLWLPVRERERDAGILSRCLGVSPGSPPHRVTHAAPRILRESLRTQSADSCRRFNNTLQTRCQCSAVRKYNL